MGKLGPETIKKQQQKKKLFASCWQGLETSKWWSWVVHGSFDSRDCEFFISSYVAIWPRAMTRRRVQVTRVHGGWSKPKLRLPVSRKQRTVLGRCWGAGEKLHQWGLGEVQRIGRFSSPSASGRDDTHLATSQEAHASSVARPPPHHHRHPTAHSGGPARPPPAPPQAGSSPTPASPASAQRLPTRGTQRRASSSWSAADSRGGSCTRALKRSGSGVPKSPWGALSRDHALNAVTESVRHHAPRQPAGQLEWLPAKAPPISGTCDRPLKN